MSELQWKPPEPNHGYSVHADGVTGRYSVCRVWVEGRWTHEIWIEGKQLKVGIASAQVAKAMCQRHHEKHLKQQGKANADAQSPQLHAGL